MMNKLEQLRAKPDHIKRMIAAGVAGGITLVIVIFWIVSLSVTSRNSSNLADTATAHIAASPFSTLSASVADAFAPVGSLFGRLKDVISGSDATSSDAIQLYASGQMNTLNQ